MSEAYNSQLTKTFKYMHVYVCTFVICIFCPSSGGKKKHSAQHTRALAVMSRNSYDTSSLLSSLLITVLYFVAYLATVLMSAEDVLIATKNGYSGPDWATSALSESEFRFINSFNHTQRDFQILTAYKKFQTLVSFSVSVLCSTHYLFNKTC